MKYNSLSNSPVWQKLKLDITQPNGVYIFISPDKALNKVVAKTFAQALVCKEHCACDKCDDCIRVQLEKHPDIIEYDKKFLVVADANDIVDKTLSTPIFATQKIFIIHNAEVMNEQAQNKLLKTLEEPNDSSMFILTTTIEYKLLPTILSRGRKIYLALNDCLDAKAEFGREIASLTEYLMGESNVAVNQAAQYLFDNFDGKTDIPYIVSNINVQSADRLLFLQNLYKLYLHQYEHNADLVNIFDRAISRLNSNVNFNYVLDDLLLELKEKIL